MSYARLAFNDQQSVWVRKHGTDMCVFTLKELIRYYIKHGSCMYVAYLDASKAFDRVNQDKLFKKLLNNGVPKWIIKVISQWYSNQTLCVKWGSVISEVFPVNNGVRQGGILSPLLFNVYIVTDVRCLPSGGFDLCIATRMFDNKPRTSDDAYSHNFYYNTTTT